MKKIIVAMSGGVDSSVAAWLLKQNGYIIEGLFMKNWEEDDNQHCISKNDYNDVNIICKMLNIKLHSVNFSFDYWNKVFIPCISQYKQCLTPNPDILCNKEIKFKIFFNFALKFLQADYIATGHYARKYLFHQKYFLLKSIDLHKDQTYFLYHLKQKHLEKTLFPLGNYTKKQVRQIANELNFVNANKKDSMGICFIGKRNFSTFINKYISNYNGLILDKNNNIVGKHNGLFYYTIGQRKGINIFTKTNCNKPWYVLDKIQKTNCLIVGEGHNNPNLFSVGLIAKYINLVINKIYITNDFIYDVKIRHSIETIKANITFFKQNTLKINFKFPVWGVTPGQSVVIYLHETCLGGGIIQKKLTI